MVHILKRLRNWAGWVCVVPGVQQGSTNFLLSALEIKYPEAEVLTKGVCTSDILSRSTNTQLLVVFMASHVNWNDFCYGAKHRQSESSAVVLSFRHCHFPYTTYPVLDMVSHQRTKILLSLVSKLNLKILTCNN